MPLFPIQPNGDACFPLPDGSCVGPRTHNPPAKKDDPNPFKPDGGDFDNQKKDIPVPIDLLPPEPMPVMPPPPERMPVMPGEGPEPLPVTPPPPQPL